MAALGLPRCFVAASTTSCKGKHVFAVAHQMASSKSLQSSFQQSTCFIIRHIQEQWLTPTYLVIRILMPLSCFWQAEGAIQSSQACSNTCNGNTLASQTTSTESGMLGPATALP